MYNGFSREELAKLIWQKPYFVQLELTRNCNFKCVFCFENCDRNEKYIDKSYNDWIKVIDQIKNLGVKQIHFSGGENFLHKDFIPIVKYAKENGLYVLVNTNGFFDITSIKDYTDEFVFSLHGYKEKNEFITGMKESFNHVEKNIKFALEDDKKVLINSVLIKDNFKEYKKLFEHLENKFPNRLKYAPTIAIKCNTGKKNYDPIEINQENINYYKQIINMIGNEKIVYKHGIYGLLVEIKKNDFDMPVCAAGKSKLIIKYNGNVYPCNFFQTDQYLCGNVFNEKLEDIWKNGNGFNFFRNYYLENDLSNICKTCKKVNNCFSGCRAWTESYINNNMNIEKERDVRCEFINAFTRDGNNDEM